MALLWSSSFMASSASSSTMQNTFQLKMKCEALQNLNTSSYHSKQLLVNQPRNEDHSCSSFPLECLILNVVTISIMEMRSLTGKVLLGSTSLLILPESRWFLEERNPPEHLNTCLNDFSKCSLLLL